MATRMATRRGNSSGGFATVRSAVIGLSRALTLGITSVAAAPLGARDHHDNVPEAEGTSLPVLYVASIVLVLLGGAFAGLTIALMGQDNIYLQVLSSDPYEPQSKNAKRVYNLLMKGKHWVLVTLLLSNVIVNETLPVVLDRCLGGGVAAVVGSTVLIVIFGEVVPQSICVRYGLQIGGFMSKPVLILMWLMAPLAWPTAKLLDWALGEDHGTVYKKSGLKQLVTLHQSLGEVSERLNEDEVTIISAVLELKEKPVANVMTPMDDVFVMAEDTVLDEKTMDRILSEGYSRIPIHATGRPTDFVGMLLVKILITYDPEDAMLVKEFPLATLPETRPETSCLDIVNFFQEGKSHMVLVSEYPGADHGAIGVVTLEDVIEELIGEEIIDESDVYIDVHKAIRRLTPAPKARRMMQEAEATKIWSEENGDLIDLDDEEHRDKRVGSVSAQSDRAIISSSPKTATFLMRRSSAGPDGRMTATAVPVKANLGDMKERLKHLGPSNRAANPKNTKSTTVKIKPAAGSAALPLIASPLALRPASISGDHVDEALAVELGGDEHSPLIFRPKLTGKGGVQAVRRSYGGIRLSDAQARLANASEGTQVDFEVVKDNEAPPPAPSNGSPKTARTELANAFSSGRGSAAGSINSVKDDGSVVPKVRSVARSGSITENVVETGRGVQKIVIQAASSDSDDTKSKGSGSSPTEYSQSRNRSNITLGRHMEEEEEDDEEDGDASQGGDGAGSSSAAPSASNSNNQGQNKKKNRRKKRKGGIKF